MDSLNSSTGGPHWIPHLLASHAVGVLGTARATARAGGRRGGARERDRPSGRRHRRDRSAGEDRPAGGVAQGCVRLTAATISRSPRTCSSGASPPSGRTRSGWPTSPYLPTDEGWLYLAAIKDMATRQIVGWSMADHLRAGLASATRLAPTDPNAVSACPSQTPPSRCCDDHLNSPSTPPSPTVGCWSGMASSSP